MLFSNRFALRSKSSLNSKEEVLKNNGNNLENFWKADHPSEVSYTYEFGAFRLDVAARQLRRAEEDVHLTPKLFDLLVFMLENKGRAISKEELLRNVWPDSFVSEENLSRHISTLRKTLDEGPDGQLFIETLSKFGYRFLDEARVITNPAEGTTSPQEVRMKGSAGSLQRELQSMPLNQRGTAGIFGNARYSTNS